MKFVKVSSLFRIFHVFIGFFLLLQPRDNKLNKRLSFCWLASNACENTAVTREPCLPGQPTKYKPPYRRKKVQTG